MPTGGVVSREEFLEARECRLLVEIATLHAVIDGMRESCAEALKDCMKANSVQATELQRAIALADRHVKGDDHG
jgi:hypothetical protein